MKKLILSERSDVECTFAIFRPLGFAIFLLFLVVEIGGAGRISVKTPETLNSRHSQLATPTVFHAESESAVRIDRIQRPGTKI